MNMFSRVLAAIRQPQAPAAPTFNDRMAAIVKAYGETFTLDDDGIWRFLRDGRVSTSGISVSDDKALKNPAVFRSVSLLSQTMGMLPFHMIDKKTKEKATDQPLFTILHRRPNDFQTAYDFRMLMQLRALVKGNGYARVLRGRATNRLMRLIPINPDHLEPKFTPDWSVVYDYRPGDGASQRFSASEILHLRGLSKCGLKGVSLVQTAVDAIGIALSAELAAARLLKNGSIIPGWLETGQQLGEPAYERVRTDWDVMYSGAENAGGTPILEQGLTYKTATVSMRDSQFNELRARQVEEIARVFGIPRPLLMVDDTSWGTGIDALGEAFVRYGLNPWFEAWQQVCEMTLLIGAEQDKYELKFNPGALTRGSLKDQGEFFAKALGSGGGKRFMTQNEVRGMLDMPPIAGGDEITDPLEGEPTDPRLKIGGNNPPEPIDDK